MLAHPAKSLNLAHQHHNKGPSCFCGGVSHHGATIRFAYYMVIGKALFYLTSRNKNLYIESVLKSLILKIMLCKFSQNKLQDTNTLTYRIILIVLIPETMFSGKIYFQHMHTNICAKFLSNCQFYDGAYFY